MAKTRLSGAFLPDPIAEDHTWTGTQTINLVVATTFKDSSGNELTLGKLFTVGEAGDIGTLTIGTVTHYLDFKGYTLTMGANVSITEAAGTGTIQIGTASFYIT